MNRRELQNIAVKLGRSKIVRNIKKESEKIRNADNSMVRVADLVDTLLEEIQLPEDDKRAASSARRPPRSNEQISNKR